MNFEEKLQVLSIAVAWNAGFELMPHLSATGFFITLGLLFLLTFA